MEGKACHSSDAYMESNGVTEDAGLVEAMEAIVLSEEVWSQGEWGEDYVSPLTLPDYGNDISSIGIQTHGLNMGKLPLLCGCHISMLSIYVEW